MTGKPEDAAELAGAAVTPGFYLRDEDMMYGPVSREDPQQPAPAAPMEALFCTVDCPDGQSRDFLCVKAEYDARPRQEPVLRMPRRKEPAAEAPQAQPAAPTQEAQEASARAAEAAPAPQAVPAPTAEAPAAAPEKPAEEAKPAAEAAPETDKPAGPASAQPEDAPLAVGQPLKILDDSRTYEETINSLNAPVSGQANLLNRNAASEPVFAAPKPAPQPTKLGGTPLQRGDARSVTPQPRNRVQETVYNQVKVSKNEPPADSLPQGARMRAVDNPVEAAEHAMRRAWQVKDARDRVLEILLSLDGVEPALERRISRRIGVTDLQKAIQEHISALEGERIRVLVELNRARDDQENYQKETIASARQKTQSELADLEEKKQSLERNVVLVKEELNQLTAQREELCGRIARLKQEALPETVARMLADSAMAVAVPEEPLRLIPVSGTQADAEALLSRVAKACRACGLAYDRNHALAALLCLGLGGRLGFSGPAPAGQATLLRNIAAVMGWESSFAIQEDRDQRPMTAAAPVDGTPAVLVSRMPLCGASARFTRVILSDKAGNQASASGYAMDQWPVVPLDIRTHVPEYREAGVVPVSAQSLTALLDAGEVESADIDAVLAPVLTLVPPLSGAAMKNLRRFVRSAASLMEGGLAVACDWAIQLWVLPSLERIIIDQEKVRLALTEYPLSTARLKG